MAISGVKWCEMVFYGEYEVNMTEGGRIVVPKKIRELLGESRLVLTKGFDNCLAGYDIVSWSNKTQNLLNDSLFTQEELMKKRLIISSAHYLDIDEQGRLIIPKNLHTQCLPNSQITIIGSGDHFEIWDKLKWGNYISSSKF